MNALLALDDVTLQFGSRVLVRELTLAVHAGERWVVLGPNGAGKSTLLAAMAGLRAPERGSVRVRGVRVQQLSAFELAQWRALMTDRWADPFAATVLDTVLTARFCRPSGGDLDATRQRLAALDAEALMGRDVRTLSRGERQRVALATALMQDTPLVLLDEPTAHQDPRHQALMVDVLRRVTSETSRACVASLHDMNAAAALATHALLLTGCGAWHAGEVSAVLTEARLTEVFAVPVRAIVSGAKVVFTLAP